MFRGTRHQHNLHLELEFVVPLKFMLIMINLMPLIRRQDRIPVVYFFLIFFFFFSTIIRPEVQGRCDCEFVFRCFRNRTLRVRSALFFFHGRGTQDSGLRNLGFWLDCLHLRFVTQPVTQTFCLSGILTDVQVVFY